MPVCNSGTARDPRIMLYLYLPLSSSTTTQIYSLVYVISPGLSQCYWRKCQVVCLGMFSCMYSVERNHVNDVKSFFMFLSNDKGEGKGRFKSLIQAEPSLTILHSLPH